LKLTIKPAARRDILHQYGHYLTLDLPRVGERFLASVENSIEALIGSGHESALHAPFARTNGELVRPELKFHFTGA
jgi:hypothetical protein